MGSRHFVQVRRRTITAWDEAMQAFIVRGFGFRAECDCGDCSQTFDSWRDARDWGRAHRRNHPRGTVLAVPVKPGG